MPELIDLLIRRAQRERTGLPPSLLRPEAEFGQPLTAAATGAQDPQSPATQPGGFDIDRMLKYLEPRQEPTGVRAAIGRALSGFAAGVRATPREAAYESGLGGVVGGLSGAGEQFEAERKRRDERDDPRREFIKAMLKEQAQQPFDISKEQREQKDKMALLERREKLAKDRQAALSRIQSEDPVTFRLAVQTVMDNPLSKIQPEEEIQSAIETRYRALRAIRSGRGQGGPPGAAAPTPAVKPGATPLNFEYYER